MFGLQQGYVMWFVSYQVGFIPALFGSPFRLSVGTPRLTGMAGFRLESPVTR